MSSSDARCTSKKEKSRHAKAVSVLQKCRYVQHHVSRKAHVCTSAAMSAASWGWCQRAPPQVLATRLKQGWKAALDVVHACSWSLVQLLLGHGSDIFFSSGCWLFSGFARLAQKRLLGNITWGRSFGTVHRLRTWFIELGWTEVRAWCWRLNRSTIDLAGRCPVTSQDFHQF